MILLGLGLSVAILSTAVFLYCEAAYRPPLPYWVQRGQHMGKLAAKWPDDWDKQPLNMHPSWSEHEVHLLQEWDTYLQRADVYVLLKQKGTLPLMQRMHAEGKLSLAAHARQQHPTPVQQLIIVAAPPVDEGFCMEDALQKLEWMLAHGANPNAMPHRRSTRGDTRYRPLNMCRRVMQQCDRQVLPAWQRMEHLLLQYGAL